MDFEDKRGQNTALAGMGLQIALGALFCAVWLITGSIVSMVIAVLCGGSVLIWTTLAAIYHCRRLADLEKREIEQLTESRDGLFDKTAQLQLAARRLELVVRWLVPVMGIIIAAGFIAIGVLQIMKLLKVPLEPATTDKSLVWAFFCLGGAFLGFLFSRYAIGMSRNNRWALLRAGGSALSLTTLLAALQCATFFMGHLEIYWPQQLLPYLVNGILAVVGLEILLNQVLDFYRPRKPGEINRPAFDSRLASLLSEPGSIAHSIAEAINYQFGFEVTGTWFYQLLQKTLLPLIIFGAVAMIAISSVLIVPAGSKALVFNWGHYSQTLAEGAHLKAPWPFQSAKIISVEQVKTMVIGESGFNYRKTEARPGEKLSAELFLWTEDHGGTREMDLLTASKNPIIDANAAQKTDSENESDSERYSAFSLLRIVLIINYRINDPYLYLQEIKNPDRLLHDIALEELSSFVAHRDVDTLLGTEGRKSPEFLQRQIAKSCDDIGLGIEIVNVSVRGIHPPPKVADAFHEALTAEQERIGSELAAKTYAESYLSNTAGSRDLAYEIANIADELHELRRTSDGEDKLSAVSARADELLQQAGGTVKTFINTARAERWEQENNERVRWILAQNKREAYNVAPKLFLLEETLGILNFTLTDQQKYIVGVDPEKLEIRYNDDRRTAAGGFEMNLE